MTYDLSTATIAFLIDITIDKLSDWKFSKITTSLNTCFQDDCVTTSLLQYAGICLMFVFVVGDNSFLFRRRNLLEDLDRILEGTPPAPTVSRRCSCSFYMC